MTLDRQIKEAKSISTERVSSTLQLDGFWLKPVDYFAHHRFEGSLIRSIVYTVVQGEVYRVVFSLFFPDIVKSTSAWEIVSVLVERDSHNSICGEESFLNTISVVAVYVDVEYSLISFQKLEDSKHTIIHIAEPRGF